MLENASELPCRGSDAKFSVGGEFDGASVCKEPIWAILVVKLNANNMGKTHQRQKLR
jgi:hypothetical protein